MDKLILESIEEELGIADEITNATNEISDIVLSNVEKQNRIKVTNGVQTNTFRFKRDIFGKTISFEFKNNYFSDVKVYFAYRKQYKPRPNKYIPESNTIRVETDFINGYHDTETLEGAIQHELEHLFQDFNAGYETKKSDQYNLASANFGNKDDSIKLVSKIIYYSEEREIYGFANQAYQALMHSGNNPREEIKNTKLYNAYQTLKTGLKFLKEKGSDKIINRLLLKFGTTNRRLSEHCQWAIDECIKYIGRVIVKSEKDRMFNDLKEGVHIELY